MAPTIEPRFSEHRPSCRAHVCLQLFCIKHSHRLTQFNVASKHDRITCSTIQRNKNWVPLFFLVNVCFLRCNSSQPQTFVQKCSHLPLLRVSWGWNAVELARWNNPRLADPPKPSEKVRQKLGMLDKNQISRWKLCESYTAVSVLAKSNFWAAQAMQDPTSFKNKIYRLGSWVGKLQEHALSKQG